MLFAFRIIRLVIARPAVLICLVKIGLKVHVLDSYVGDISLQPPRDPLKVPFFAKPDIDHNAIGVASEGFNQFGIMLGRIAEKSLIEPSDALPFHL